MRSSTLLTLAVVIAGLLGRSALDKVLAVQGGADLVSQWAQVASVIDLVTGVSGAGLGYGLAVLVAQTGDAASKRALYRESLRAGMLISLPAMLLLSACALLEPEWFGGREVPGWWLALGAAIGWIAVLPSMTNAYWQGLQQRRQMLVFTMLSATCSLLAAWAAPAPWRVAALLAAQALQVLVLLVERPGRSAISEDLRRRLWRFLVPGLSIGVLSPLSMLIARNLVAQGLSWHDAGVLQALWRMQDWVGGIAGGLMSVLFLPRLAAAHGSAQWRVELGRMAAWTLAPSALALACTAAFQAPLLAALYAPDFRAEAAGAWLLSAGGLFRILAWIPLFGLYAQHRTRSIAWTEVLSLPLFVGLLALQGGHLTLTRIGACWLAAYLVYASANLSLMRVAHATR